jgi:membrane protein required for colicin V production
MDPLSINSFDAVIYGLVVVAVVMGFRSGLLRSVATIVGYLAAMPFALATAPALALVLTDQFHLAPIQPWAAFCGIFLFSGILLSALLRRAVSDITGPTVSIVDRVAGAMLGAVRIGLLAVLMVVIFDRIIPPNRQPAFLVDSRLRPILSLAGRQGLKSLPPDVADFIDQLKRARRI